MKEKLVFIAKYIFGLGLLIWLLARFDTRQILAIMLGFEWYVLSVIAALVVANLGMQFLRWRYLVASHSTDYHAGDLLPAFLAGFAFRMMIPGGYAEVSKVLLMPGKKRGKVVAFGLEKYFETYIKIMLILIALPLVFDQYGNYLWLLATAGLSVYFFLPRLLRSKYLLKLQEKEVVYHRLFFRILIFTAVIFFLIMSQYAILLNSIGYLAVNKTIIAVIFIWGGGLIPVSVAGVGVRENLAVYFLGQYGIPPETAVGVALFVFFFNAALPAMAGLIFIVRKRHEIKGAGSDVRHAAKNLYNRYSEHRNRKKVE